MKKAAKDKYIFSAIAAFIILFSVLLCVLLKGSGELPYIITGCVILLLLLSVIFMLHELKRTLAVSLYEYKNIVLIGDILFASVLTVVFITYFIWCLHSRDLSLEYVYETVLKFPQYFSYYALFTIIAVSILVGISNIELIRREGLCLNNALCLVVAGFYIVATVLAYRISYLFSTGVFVPDSLADTPIYMINHTVLPMFILVMLCYFECVFAGAAIMGWKAAHHKPSHDKDFIIILGCSIDKRGGLLPLLKGRVNRAIRFAWEQEIATGKPVKYVPSGGQGSNEIMSEGSAMELYLLSHGAEDYEVFPEKKSVNTWENMCFSKAIIDELKPGAKVAFATTNYHILRSGILARKAGLDAEGIAGDTKWYFWPNGFIREFFGILKLSIRAHISNAIGAAVLCTVIGFIGWFGSFI